MGVQKIAARPQNLPALPPPPPPIVNDRSLTNVLHAKKKGFVRAKLKERPVSQLSFTIKGGGESQGRYRRLIRTKRIDDITKSF